MYDIEHYRTSEGKDLFLTWVERLRDQKARLAIFRRVARIVDGNFGDHKPCQEGVWELRINLGPGYRVYYGLAGSSVVLLLCGGDKVTQSQDIERAIELWKTYRRG